MQTKLIWEVTHDKGLVLGQKSGEYSKAQLGANGLNALLYFNVTAVLSVLLLLFWTDSPSDAFVKVVLVT